MVFNRNIFSMLSCLAVPSCGYWDDQLCHKKKSCKQLCGTECTFAHDDQRPIQWPMHTNILNSMWLTTIQNTYYKVRRTSRLVVLVGWFLTWFSSKESDLTFVLSKDPKPISFIISISSSVFPCMSSAVRAIRRERTSTYKCHAWVHSKFVLSIMISEWKYIQDQNPFYFCILTLLRRVFDWEV